MEDQYFDANRRSWNKRTEIHYESDFYDINSFIQGRSSLNQIELELLGDIKGKDLIHPMCHFGQDSLSLARLGAKVTGIDISDQAIEKAKNLSKTMDIAADFICSNYYDIPSQIDEEFDLFFSSYGVIGWLPDLKKWAEIANKLLKQKGKLVLVEFHPFIWMYDDDFTKVQYHYFNRELIATNESSYTDKESEAKESFYSWNHSLSEVINSLIQQGFKIESFKEYDYSPYDCFRNTIEIEKGKYQIENFGNKVPMVYSIVATKE